MTLRRSLASLFLTAAMVAPVGAQTPERNILQIRYYKMKTDRIADFQSAGREAVELHKKNSDTHDYTVWTSLTGAREYVRVDRYSKLADLDAPANEPSAEMARLNTRIVDCFEDSRTVIARIVPDSSLPLGDPPPMIEVVLRHFQPGKAGEYPALVKNEFLPILKKAGFKTFFIARTMYGATTLPETIGVLGFQSWAEVESNAAVSTPEFQAFQLKRRQLSAGTVENVYRFRADLSYLPAQTMPTRQ